MLTRDMLLNVSKNIKTALGSDVEAAYVFIAADDYGTYLLANTGDRVGISMMLRDILEKVETGHEIPQGRAQ